MKYTDGWKYRIEEDALFQTYIEPKEDIDTEYVSLNIDGLLTVKRGFCFDGPSGEIKLFGIISIDLTRDTKKFMRGACVHDALAYLMRQEKLEVKWYHEMNQEFLKILLQDKMWEWKARAAHKVVNNLRFYIDPKNKKKILTAP